MMIERSLQLSTLISPTTPLNFSTLDCFKNLIDLTPTIVLEVIFAHILAKNPFMEEERPQILNLQFSNSQALIYQQSIDKSKSVTVIRCQYQKGFEFCPQNIEARENRTRKSFVSVRKQFSPLDLSPRVNNTPIRSGVIWMNVQWTLSITS